MFGSDLPSIRDLWSVLSIATRCRLHCRRIQEPRKSRHTPLVQHRTRFRRRIPGTIRVSPGDLEYGDVSELRLMLEGSASCPEAYWRAILDSDS